MWWVVSFFLFCFKLFVQSLQICLFLQVAAFLSVVSPTSFVRSGVLNLISASAECSYDSSASEHFQERRAIGRTRAGISPNCLTDMLTIPRSTSYAVEQTCIDLLQCVSVRFPVAPPDAAWQGVVYMPKDKTFASEVSCTTLRCTSPFDFLDVNICQCFCSEVSCEMPITIPSGSFRFSSDWIYVKIVPISLHRCCCSPHP